MSMLLFLACLCFVQSAPLFALRAQDGVLQSLVTADPARGFMTNLIDLTDFAYLFTSLLNITSYDPNTDIFAFGNSQPPILALANTLSKKVALVYLPDYGQLLSLTTYDEYVYCLFGLDPEIPNDGRLVTVDLGTQVIRQIGRWKLDPTSDQSFYPGTPFAFLPTLASFVFQLKGGAPVIVTANGSRANMVPSNLPPGYLLYWADVTRSVLTLVGLKNSTIFKLDPISGTATPLRHFQCPGMFAIDFRGSNIYDLAECNDQLIMQTVTFANKTVSNVEVDAGLATVVGLHANNAYVPFGCGMPCSIHPDCAQFKSCGTCRLGKCSDDGNCGAFCFNNGDCFAGVCAGNCEDNRCGRQGCANTCLNHDDCKAMSKTCQVCRLGRCCDAGECGNYCLSPTDCYGSSCLGRCNTSSYKCTA